MQTSSLAEILESTKKFVAAKNAELKEKSAKGLDTTGAKDDAPIQHKDTLTASEPAKEVPGKKDLISGDANAKPPTDESGTGSNKAQGKNEGNQTDRVGSGVYEADQPAASPTKKDLISGDANAKQAATANLANEIISDIRAYQDSTKTAEQKPAAAPVKDEKKAEAPAAAPAPVVDEKKAESKEEKAESKMPAALKAKVEKAESPAKEKAEDKAEAKMAQGPNMELTTDVLAKIAAAILSQEEGAVFVEQMLAKQAGAEAAQEVMNFLAAQSEAAEKQAAYAAGQADADALIKQAIYAKGKADAQAQAKNANFEKLGQEVADASMADLTAAQGAGMGGEGGDEEITMEDLAAALEALVSEGTLQPEEAQQIVEYIVSQEGGGGEAAPAAAPAAAPVAAPAAPEKAEGGSEKEEEKESAAKKPATPATKAAALLETINKLRAAKK